ncbi:MAG: hypothetical protein QCI82_06765 [Candidatus Thermoplasmatota archaeon]|nr:hypothetical protein [Candidatus Thermoplasmatota archaeon]
MRTLPLSLLMALMLIPIGSHILNHDGIMEPSRGSVLYVGEGYTFSDIQSAIDSSSEGDLIMVGEGSRGISISASTADDIRSNQIHAGPERQVST